MSLVNILDYASKKYYEGDPIMSDEEFDRLAEKIHYTKVGYDIKNGYEHLKPLLSLQKVFEGENKNPLDAYRQEDIVITPKLDGAAIALTYLDKKLFRVLTRGDGIRGLDVTNNVKHLIPDTISTPFNVIQVVGEVVAPKTIPNARNYAAGALSLLDENEFKSRDLQFIAHDIFPYLKRTWSEDLMEFSRRNEKFVSVLDFNWEEYPHDGIVFRVDDHLHFNAAGFTSHHPKGAYALKKVPKGVVTKLLDVIWQVGKSGVVSPVAILEPIKIDNAIISKATLHNIKYIEDLNLEIGCDVEVIRSGDIIPRVVQRV